MVQIRRMKPEDLDAVAKIEEESFSMPWSWNAFADTLAAEQYHCFVAEEGKGILGYGVLLSAADEGEIPNICVASAARRQGVGACLMEALCSEAKACGIAALYLEVRQSNMTAQSLYRRFDFEEIGIRKGFYDLPKEDAVLMRKAI